MSALSNASHFLKCRILFFYVLEGISNHKHYSLKWFRDVLLVSDYLKQYRFGAEETYSHFYACFPVFRKGK